MTIMILTPFSPSVQKIVQHLIVQSFYDKKWVNPPQIATEFILSINGSEIFLRMKHPKYRKIQVVEQCLICINPRWPPQYKNSNILMTYCLLIDPFSKFHDVKLW